MLPGLFRHPRKFVYGTFRSNHVGIPRAKAGNNIVGLSCGYEGRSHEAHQRRSRMVYVANLTMWRSVPTRSSGYDGSRRQRSPHSRAAYRDARKAISSLSGRRAKDKCAIVRGSQSVTGARHAGLWPSSPDLPRRLRFIVSRDTCPNHARMFVLMSIAGANEVDGCGVAHGMRHASRPGGLVTAKNASDR